MSTFKDVLCLLSIFIAYGVTGRLDYEDAVQLEQMRQERRNADCLLTTPSEEREEPPKVDGYSGDKSTVRQAKALPEDGRPCAPQLL